MKENNSTPPKLLLRFFHWYCHTEYQEDIEGDLRERFERRVGQKGIRAAKWGFTKDVLLLFRPEIIRSLELDQNLNHYAMFINYFKIAYRNLWRYKSHSLINISGLAIGVAATLLMLMYVTYELGYDKNHVNADRIYRVGLHGKLQDSEFHQIYTTAMLAAEMKNTFPEVENSTRLIKLNNPNFQLLEDSLAIKSYIESAVYGTDSTLFDIFSMEMLVGNGKKAMASVGKIILSERSAIRYFGHNWDKEDILSKTLSVKFGGQLIPLSVAGVARDVPEQSHFHFDILISTENFPSSKATNWWNNNYTTYVLLSKNASAATLESKLPGLYEKHLPASAFEDGNEWWSFLQPLTDIHLKSNLRGEFEPNGNITYVYIFLVTAILILVMACVNFVNLTVARAANRFKEIGIRKVIGSGRTQLIFQHLMESQVYVFIAVILALGILISVLPFFNDFTGLTIKLATIDFKFIIPILLLFTIVLGAIAGLYPALYLTKFAPVKAIKGSVGRKGKNAAFKNSLVIVQFVISIGIITGSMIISKQLHFIQNKNLGFDKEGVLIIENLSFINANIHEFKNALQQNPQVISSSASLSVPTRPFTNVQFRPEGHENMAFDFIFADKDFIETYGIQINEGRFFSEEFFSDSSAMVINQAMAKNLGWEQPVGKKIQLFGDPDLTFKVIGIIEDFHHESLHHAKIPIAILPSFSRQSFGDNYLSIRITGNNIQQSLSNIETIWKEFVPGSPISYFFLDDFYNSLYKGEQQTKSIFKLFSGLTALIAILGLIGLVSYVTQQRRKEISIRKVLGASVSHLLAMLAKGFLLSITIAFVITVPLVWVMMENWLQNFSYRIDIPWTPFAMAGIFAIVVSLLTICIQSLKSVLVNPVVNLKDE